MAASVVSAIPSGKEQIDALKTGDVLSINANRKDSTLVYNENGCLWQ